ncbi:SOS response-associated peptidase [Prochlorococcus sp. MIT 1300]|uniref:SOS response-associated peptidase n=1 Tax=Prochlorococcus sp. MIT 1300 TaxID=3096218 RepID=UPI002A74E8D1|nr:SOS response-associated peptidase [Prochlorococcus sp. MIT 1300]
MCGSFELIEEFYKLPKLLRNDFPKGLELKYEMQSCIRPGDPVIVLKNEGKAKTSLMLWGFISQWSKNPLDASRLRPFNARAETVGDKRLFRGSWKHNRCLIPATAFFEKGYRFRKKNSQTFWLAGIWNRWMSPEGSELESCCVLTTQPNELVRPIHNRMPVVIPDGFEEEWIESVKDLTGLKALHPFLKGWNHYDWMAEPILKTPTSQLSLF